MEIFYNMALCYLKMENFPKTLQLLKICIEKCPGGEEKDQLVQFKSLVEGAIQAQIAGENFDQDEIIDISPFPSDNRLCSIFPHVELELGVVVRTRLFFCLPRV